MSKKIKTTKNDFQFVGQERKVYDQQIEGKPIGYLQDAFIRFRKNKANLVAAVILMLLILMAIFVPVVTTKNYVEIEEQLTYLSPRVPILEKLGILDGTKKVKKEIVDLSTIDNSTGLGLPKGYDLKFVKKGSLENFPAPSNDSGETSLGGKVIFRLDSNNKLYITSSVDPYTFKNTGEFLNLDIHSVEELNNGSVSVYILIDGEKFYLANDIETAGIKKVPIDLPAGKDNVESNIFLEVKSNVAGSSASLNSISILNNKDEKVVNHDGYNLYSYKNVLGRGSKLRVDNYSIYAKFEYDQYSALFDSRIITIGGLEYNQLMEENNIPEPVADPNNPGQLIFEEGYVLKRVLSIDTSGGYSTYNVEVNYAKYMGYKNVPYFIFGTDASGRDLFALTWVGLRTSLIIGIIVSIINISFGVVYGAISGYYGGKVDLVMERITEIIGRIPWLVTLSIFTALLGPGFLTLIIILIISGWIGVASVTRTQFYRYKNSEYVLASRTLGAKDSRLIFRHILPNGIGTIITSSILMIPGVVFSESSISYLGFGIGHGQTINFFGLKLSGVSLGVLLADGQSAILNYPHLTLYPAIIISLLMIAFNIFGNGLRDAFNPSLRGTE